MAPDDGTRPMRRGGRGVPIIGIAGGIGSGKSAVARAFASLGCLVSDSDKATRAALESPDVKAVLVEWWGRGVIAADGSVDRVAVAKIVFDDEDERRRLESMTHPRARADRERVIARAEASGAPGVVVDAPLLFEAGLDAVCDLVVFVDVPPAERARRIEDRAWSPGELARREAVQLDVVEKRRRSDAVIDNSGPLGALKSQAEQVLRLATERHAENAARA